MKKSISRLVKGCAVAAVACVLLAACILLVLKTGITVDRFRFGDVTVEQVHLRLEKKLNLTAGDIVIAHGRQVSKNAIDLAVIRRAMLYLDLAVRYFQSITIKKITIDDTTASFSLKGDGSGTLTIDNPAYSLSTALSYTGKMLTLDVKRFTSITFHSHGSGEIRMDVVQKKYVGDITVDLAQTLPLQLHLEGDRHQLSFAGKGTAVVHDIRPVVELFALGPDVQPWITDFQRGSSYRLDAIRGTIPYAAPENVFRSLYGKAFVQGCEYSFEQKLPSIKARTVDVIFEKGVLKIYPHQATYAGIDAGRSWLDIDFTTDEPVLTAFIRTKAILGDEILGLLDFYGIHLPFKQTEGLTDAELTLAINLENSRVRADGHFMVEHGAFFYDRQVYSVADATVLLADDDVTIKKLTIGYKDMARVQVAGELAVASKKAELTIAVDTFDLPFAEKRLTLDDSKRKLLLRYHRDRDIETITASASDWMIGTVPAKVEGFTTSVQAEELSGTLKDIGIDVSPYTRVVLSGDYNLRTPGCHLAADFQGWDTGGVRLDQQHFPVDLTYAGDLQITSDQESDWLINGKKVHLSPFKLGYGKEKISFGRVDVHLENVLDGALQGVFDIAAGKGDFVLDQVEVTDGDADTPDFSGENLAAELAITGGTISATVPEVGLSFQRKQASNWTLHVEDLGKLYDHSAFLRKYNLDKGSVDIWQTGTATVMFSGSITSPYAFLVKNNIPVNVFNFKGQYAEGNLVATINNDVHLHHLDRMQISSSGIGYNFSALRTYLEDHFNNGGYGSDDKIPDFDLQADNSSLYLNPYQSAPADRIQIHSENGKLTGQLRFGKGKAEIEMNNVNFTLLGQDFGEKFLDGLLKDSQFIGGKLSFYVSGLLTKFKGVVKIDNSVMKNGVILNNIMAFISTVPDLITFSLPGYSLQGMPFSQLYAGFFYDNHSIDVSTFAVESNALDMTGTGRINLVKNSIKMTIDLISKTKKYLSKIPLLGYLLVGDTKQPTVTLNVEGKLDDPHISTSVYKEIVKTPFDILLRAISLPSHLMEQIGGSATDSSAPGKPPAGDKKP